AGGVSGWGGRPFGGEPKVNRNYGRATLPPSGMNGSFGGRDTRGPEQISDTRTTVRAHLSTSRLVHQRNRTPRQTDLAGCQRDTRPRRRIRRGSTRRLL